jgi:hypothetical protein
MKLSCVRLVMAVCAGVVCGLVVEARGDNSDDAAGPTRTQTIAMQVGWNAVFLEVEPPDPDPAVVFAGAPVEMVAGYTARTAAAQFVSDPNANLFRRAGWGVWYAADRPDAFLKTLHAIHGRHGYLVQSREAFSLSVTGQVVSDEVRWRPNAFNLVGFSVASPGAPTFAQFFAGSKAHQHNRLYRLEDGSWRRITDPAAEAMRSGEAFWIYCDGPSTYQGPLRVQTPIAQQVLLTDRGLDVTLRNESGHPLNAVIEHVPAGHDPVPLSVLIQTVDNRTAVLRRVAAAKPAGPWAQTLPVLEAGEAIRLPLEARRQEMRQARQTSLLRISTDLGTETWLTVVAVREDLEEQ